MFQALYADLARALEPAAEEASLRDDDEQVRKDIDTAIQLGLGHPMGPLTLLDLIRLGQNFTIQQFLTRENFAKRLEKGRFTWPNTKEGAVTLVRIQDEYPRSLDPVDGVVSRGANRREPGADHRRARRGRGRQPLRRERGRRARSSRSQPAKRSRT